MVRLHLCVRVAPRRHNYHTETCPSNQELLTSHSVKLCSRSFCQHHLYLKMYENEKIISDIYMNSIQLILIGLIKLYSKDNYYSDRETTISALQYKTLTLCKLRFNCLSVTLSTLSFHRGWESGPLTIAKRYEIFICIFYCINTFC